MMYQERDDSYWMGLALREARKAAAIGEVPIGAVIVRDGRVLGRGYNLREKSLDPTSHAEMIAIRRAARKAASWRLLGATLYVTLEPCPMCMGAIILARLERVVFGCHDPKAGAAGSLYDLSADPRLNHRVLLTSGVCRDECSSMLSRFFTDLRREKKRGILVTIMEKNFTQLLKDGIAALEAGQPNRALEQLESAAELEESAEVLSYLAVCLATVRQDFATAERLCREAIEDDPRNSLHYLNFGRVLLLADRKAEAIRTFRNGLLRQSNPKIKQELQRLGVRKFPVIASLPREHLLNRFLGKILNSLRLR